MKATGTHKPTNWQESTIEEHTPQTRLSKVSAEFEINDGIQGTTKTEYLMYYSSINEKDMHASTASYLGYSHFEGTINARRGSFVMEDRGTFESGVASSELRILAGSGVGELAGISGKGDYSASQSGAIFELEYELSPG